MRAISFHHKALAAAAILAVAATAALAQQPAAPTRQPLNWPAIIMFGAFVLFTLGITKWAAGRTKSAADFYTAGGGITGFQNGLALAGDYVGGVLPRHLRPRVRDRLRRTDLLGRLARRLAHHPVPDRGAAAQPRQDSFADVASFRLQPTPIRLLSAIGTLSVVAFYLIAQMVGAGKLIELLFGLPYLWAVICVGALMIIYVAFGGMTATTWVQIIKACLLLGGATFMALAVLYAFSFNPEALFKRATEIHPKGLSIMGPGGLVTDPVSAISLGMA